LVCAEVQVLDKESGVWFGSGGSSSSDEPLLLLSDTPGTIFCVQLSSFSKN